MTKLILAAMTALNRQVAVPGSSPKRYPEDAVRMGTAGMARISASMSLTPYAHISKHSMWRKVRLMIKISSQLIEMYLQKEEKYIIPF
jgi:hypothetical protein